MKKLTMKNILPILSLIIVVSCGGKQQTAQWPIEPKNERVELMLQLDSMNLALMGDSSSKYDAASQIYADQEGASLEQAAKVMKDTYREADEAWHKFVYLCNEDKIVEAVNFYRENQTNINIALSHSIVRFMFHDEVLGYLAYEALPEPEAQALMIEALEFDFMIFEAQLVVLNPDNETAATYFEYAYRMLRELYYRADRHDDMLTLIDRWFAVGCRNTPRAQNNSTSVEIINIGTDSTEAGNTSHEDVIQDESLDSVYNDETAFTYEYIGTIHGYKIKAEIKEYKTSLADHTYSVTYILRNVNTGKKYTVPTISIAFDDAEGFNRYTEKKGESVKYTPHHTNTKDVITAPYQDFFFADLDFDGTEEFITDNRPGMAEQRGVGLFTAIYKLEGDEAIDCTEYFQSKSDVFKHIEEYFFSVNTKTKSIIHSGSGGATHFSWDIYDYKNDSYIYRYTVSVETELLRDHDFAHISIYPSREDYGKNKNMIAQYIVRSENLAEFMDTGILENRINDILEAFNNRAVITDHFTYKELINGYRVTGDITTSPLMTNIILHFHHTTLGNKFSVNGGHGNFILCQSGENDYTSLEENDSLEITAPSELFFFADLDFDGEKELITEISPFEDTINDIWRLCRIYKIINGKPVDHTKYFTDKCDAFNHIESYCFSINYQTKSIRFNQPQWDWDIYDYINGNYLYRHYVSVDELENGNKYQVSIYPTIDDKVYGRTPLKIFKVDREEFFKNQWLY